MIPLLAHSKLAFSIAFCGVQQFQSQTEGASVQNLSNELRFLTLIAPQIGDRNSVVVTLDFIRLGVV